MCIDIVEIWFVIANGQISSIFDKSYLPPHKKVTEYIVLLFHSFIRVCIIWYCVFTSYNQMIYFNI